MLETCPRCRGHGKYQRSAGGRFGAGAEHPRYNPALHSASTGKRTRAVARDDATLALQHSGMAGWLRALADLLENALRIGIQLGYTQRCFKSVAGATFRRLHTREQALLLL